MVPLLPPSFLPRAFAAASAFLVRSEMKPASNSATATSCCSMNRPVGPSMAGRSAKRTSTPVSRSLETIDTSTRVTCRYTDTDVQAFPGRECVVLPGAWKVRVQRIGDRATRQICTIARGAGGQTGHDPLNVLRDTAAIVPVIGPLAFRRAGHSQNHLCITRV